jgi:hypothetical protein
MVDGANFENLIVSDVIIRDAVTPLFLRLGNRGRGQAVPVPGTLKAVQFSNIVASGGSLASSITGIPGHPVEDVSLSDIDITMARGGAEARLPVAEAEGTYPQAPMFGALPASGLYVRHVRGLTLRNVRLRTSSPTNKPVIVLEDVDGVDSDGPVERITKSPRSTRSSADISVELPVNSR